MANEGSTKPTYSELEAQNAYLSGELSKRDKGLETLRERIRNLEIMNGGNKTSSAHYREELARVRGLLQRTRESLQRILSVAKSTEKLALFQAMDEAEKGLCALAKETPLPVPPNFPQSSSLVPSGAESADIGKLETADKKGAE